MIGRLIQMLIFGILSRANYYSKLTELRRKNRVVQKVQKANLTTTTQKQKQKLQQEEQLETKKKS